MKMFEKISNWLVTLFRVWRREFALVFHDEGVLLFFFALPLGYPIVYTLIYNPEVLRNIPIVVVDDSRTAESREFVRMIDATDGIEVYDYLPDMGAAKRAMAEKKCYGVLHVPEHFAKNIGNGVQSVVPFYSDMSLLFRYRTFLFCLTDVQLAYGAKVQMEKIDDLGLLGETAMGSAPSATTEAYMLGNVTQGFASFIIPGILVLILQQSLILGVTMLAGGSEERRRRNNGVDPLAIPADPFATVLGKTMCYLIIYIPLMFYVLHFVPLMFSLPHVGNIWEEMLLLMPMIIAASLLGTTISCFVTERETSMLVIVFTSVVFLFLSGLTWPRYAMSPFWTFISDCVPATWGVEGFVRLNTNGATFAEETQPYHMLWLLSAVYAVTAMIMVWVRNRYDLRRPAPLLIKERG